MSLYNQNIGNPTMEALERAMWRPHFVCGRRLTGPGSRPGEIIEGMPEEQRAALRKLRSDDIANIAPWVVKLWVDAKPTV